MAYYPGRCSEAYPDGSTGMTGSIPKWWLYVLVLLAVWIVASTLWSSSARRPLVHEQITLSPPGRLTVDLDIPFAEKYDLLLEFSREGLSFDTLKRLFGESDNEGVPVHLNWSLDVKGDGNISFGQKTSLRGSWSWSRKFVSRYIGEVLVPPGRYVLAVQVLGPVPSDRQFPARANLVLRTNAKSITTWQLGLAWWMTTINVVLVVASLALTVYLYSARRTVKHRNEVTI